MEWQCKRLPSNDIILMKSYRIRADNINWKHQYDFTVYRKWQMPMVICHVCGTEWGDTVAYPTVECSKLPNENQFENQFIKNRKCKRVKLDEYISLRNQIQSLLPQNLSIPPGAGFGPLFGTTYGQHGDFTWTHPAVMMIHPEALSKLIVAGIKMPPTVQPEIKARGKKPFEHLEFQTEEHLRLSERSIKRGRPNCPVCGSSGISAFIEPDLIVKSSIPKDLDIFRLNPRNNYIHVTERFVDAVRSLGLTNIRFEPFEVADE
jgi:uncharacterized double-CXXCG motif protein